jgi:hypothetical protein
VQLPCEQKEPLVLSAVVLLNGKASHPAVQLLGKQLPTLVLSAVVLLKELKRPTQILCSFGSCTAEREGKPPSSATAG